MLSELHGISTKIIMENGNSDILSIDELKQIEIKNLTRIILFWTDNPALPDMYVEQGFEWTQELDVLCRVACEFLAE